MCGVVIAVGFFQCQRIKCSGFVIVGITVVELLHGVQIPVPSLVVFPPWISVDGGFGGDIIPFTGRRCVQRFCEFDLFPSALALLFIWSGPAAEGRGNSPMTHRTMRIVLCDLAGCDLCGVGGERMQQRDSPFELFLYLRVARNREMDRPELLLGQ